MRVSTATSSIDARQWESAAEMTAHVRRFKAGVVLGTAGRDDAVGSFVYQEGPAEDASVDVAIGVAWTPDTYEPQTLVVDGDADDLIVVGFGFEVVGLSRKTLRVNFRIELTTYFGSISYLKDIGLLVFEEVGVSLVSLAGVSVWSILTDVITKIRLDGNRDLCLEFVDHPPLKVNVMTGAASE